MKIVKVLNNNAVVCAKDTGEELIAMGRGLAFGQKAGSELDEAKIEKLFVLQSEEKRNMFLQFINEIPSEEFLIAQKIISGAQESSKKLFDDSIYITLTDHLHGAIERAKSNVSVTNPLTSAIKSFYPKEFELGLLAVNIIKEELGIALPVDEAAFFTMHFVTAELGESTPKFNTVLTFVQDIGDIARQSLESEVDETSTSWQRFLTHLSFFAQRIMTGKQQSDKEALLYDSVSASYPKAFECVEKIVKYVKDNYSYEVGLDEKTYLMIHVNRLQLEFGIKAE